MKNKKYKVVIPEGYEVENEYSCLDQELKKRIVIELKSIKKELPKTWEEYCNSNKIPPWLDNRAFIPEKHRALGKLEILRDDYNDGWKPDWTNENEPKDVIWIGENKVISGSMWCNNAILAFKNERLRDEFLSNFRELIETAKPLL